MKDGQKTLNSDYESSCSSEDEEMEADQEDMDTLSDPDSKEKKLEDHSAAEEKYDETVRMISEAQPDVFLHIWSSLYPSLQTLPQAVREMVKAKMEEIVRSGAMRSTEENTESNAVADTLCTNFFKALDSQKDEQSTTASSSGEKWC